MASIYLHIPFCERKCIYCDFYSVESRDSLSGFHDSLLREIEMYAAYGALESIETVYFGGGTPSLLEPPVIRSILDQLRKFFTIEYGAEITLEVNPGTVNNEKLTRYRDAGINRLSVGIQSFQEEDLKFLTRIHTVEQAHKVISTAKGIGLNNMNIDLIFALPNQTLDRWRRNLESTIQLEPQHISTYSLIVESGTPLSRMVSLKKVPTVSIETEAVLYEFTMIYLQEAGYEHYEVSNFAKPGYQSRHNCNYWNHANYLGFGPSAHSFWYNRRWWNVANLNRYYQYISMDRPPIAGEESLSVQQLRDEAIMLGLRSNGVNLRRLKIKDEEDLPRHTRSMIDQLVMEKLAIFDKCILRLTDKGFLICDAITERFMSQFSSC